MWGRDLRLRFPERGRGDTGGAGEGLSRRTAPQVRVRSTVGAGDALVGGLVAAFARGQDQADALRLGVCCGSGTAQKPGTGLFTREDIDRLLDEIKVHFLDI